MNPNVACHKLAINPIVKLVQQKKRHHDLKQSVAIEVKIEKLLKVRFIKKSITRNLVGQCGHYQGGKW